MQHITTHAPAARPTARRLAWLVLGLLALASAAFEVVAHGLGALGLALVFLAAPDLTMLAGARRPLPRGQIAPAAVPWYNSLHGVWGPLMLLAACTFWIDSAALFTGGLAWLTHIAIDRGLGFGLRTREGFQGG
jgi:hypothetical protein